MQMKKVTAAIMKEAQIAANKSYSAIVNPTESASIEVAIPWTRRTQNESRGAGFSSSDFFFRDRLENHFSANVKQKEKRDPRNKKLKL